MTHREVLEAISGLLLVLFVSMISATIVGTALPRIIGALHGSQTQFTWVVTATLLTATVTTPIWGRLADLFSKKLMIQISIGIFIVGSIVAGFAQTAPQLIAARALQGIGVGGLQALVQVVIAAMVPPRERGRYNGYLGAVMAVATVGGPLVGGVIVDTSWLGWRWCFFIGVPIAVAAFALLQKTLHLPVERRDDVKIDYLGAGLIAAGVSILLIWITFVDKSFAWLSWQTAAMVIPSVLLLALAIWVEKRTAQPVVPVDVVVQRVPMLAILASLAVGMAMFGGVVFLGQYFQTARGYSPTEAGLLTVPMMGGLLISSTISGRMISRSGRIKPHVVTGALLLIAGNLMLGFTDHDSPLWYLMLGMLAMGTGVGLCMQNLVLAVQNAVPLRELGAASGAVTFFRSLGGTAGVTVLGAALANRLTTNVTEGLARAGIPVPAGGGGTGDLDIDSLPEPIQGIVRAAFGDATGIIFLISAGIAVVGLVAALLMPKVTLRTTIDMPADPGADGASGTAGERAAGRAAARLATTAAGPARVTAGTAMAGTAKAGTASAKSGGTSVKPGAASAKPAGAAGKPSPGRSARPTKANGRKPTRRR